jgi:hypothetical protein
MQGLATYVRVPRMQGIAECAKNSEMPHCDNCRNEACRTLHRLVRYCVLNETLQRHTARLQWGHIRQNGRQAMDGVYALPKLRRGKHPGDKCGEGRVGERACSSKCTSKEEQRELSTVGQTHIAHEINKCERLFVRKRRKHHTYVYGCTIHVYMAGTVSHWQEKATPSLICTQVSDMRHRYTYRRQAGCGH